MCLCGFSSVIIDRSFLRFLFRDYVFCEFGFNSLFMVGSVFTADWITKWMSVLCLCTITALLFTLHALIRCILNINRNRPHMNVFMGHELCRPLN